MAANTEAIGNTKQIKDDCKNEVGRVLKIHDKLTTHT